MTRGEVTTTLNPSLENASRTEMIAQLQQDVATLQGADDDLVEDYLRTIAYLERVTDVEYQVLHHQLLSGEY
ncbi:hypothetical protein [Streptococcus dentiloxodontae]